jgi:MSHA biogenesis protein MshK
MAAYLTLGLALAMGAQQALAQGLSDPTRPPWIGGAHALEPAAAAQVVIVSKDRRQATINGQIVNLGGRYGNATLVRITDEEIVLERPKGTETIRLYSSVQRKRHGPAAQPEIETAKRREEGRREAN